MAEIASSVGSGGTNRDADVREVQSLLNATPAGAGGPNPVLDIDGWCGDKTIAAIRAFQQRQLGWQDGRVDPGKPTIGRLNQLAREPGSREVPLPDLDPAQLALQSIPLAVRWATAGFDAAGRALDASAAGTTAGLDAVLITALGAHFRLTPDMPSAQFASLLAIVRRNFSNALQTLNRAPLVFVSVTRRQGSLDQAPDAPGYTRFGEKIRWSPHFHTWVGDPPNRPGLDWAGHGFGQKARAAMVLHEPIHNVDILANFDIYEHGTGYLTMSAQQAVHNASSYPSFGAHIEENSNLPLGPRYGAGRPQD